MIVLYLSADATVSFNPVEYSGMEGDGPLMVCVQIFTMANSSENDISVVLETVDGVKTGMHL